MARPTRNRRSTKHRGNAAGMIESRGRTGRKPQPSEKSTRGGKSGSGSTRRKNRYDNPPTWKGAAMRAVLAAVIVFGVSTVLLKQSSAARNLILVPLVLVLYTPLIYYTDLFMYRRAQRKKSAS
jgi:hypothetical protein